MLAYPNQSASLNGFCMHHNPIPYARNEELYHCLTVPAHLSVSVSPVYNAKTDVPGPHTESSGVTGNTMLRRLYLCSWFIYARQSGGVVVSARLSLQ